MKIELEITPEIEEWDASLDFPIEKRFIKEGLVQIVEAIRKAKKQPKIEKIGRISEMACGTNLNVIYRHKINEIIEWINNHD